MGEVRFMNRKTKQGAALALAGLMALSAVHVSAFHVEAADNETAETLVITTEKDVKYGLGRLVCVGDQDSAGSEFDPADPAG